MKLGTRTAIVVVVVVVAAAAIAATTTATSDGQTAQLSQQEFETDGLPLLVANSLPEGKGDITWSTCAPSGECAESGHDNILQPGDVPVGTTFTATVAY